MFLLLCGTVAYNFALVESLRGSLTAMITVIVLGFFTSLYDGSDALLNKENIILWTLILLSLHYLPPFPSSLLLSAPYSIRNLSDSTMSQYELDSKFCRVSVSHINTHTHMCAQGFEPQTN